MDKLGIDVVCQIWEFVVMKDVEQFALTSRLIYLAGKARIKRYNELEKKYGKVVLQNHNNDKSDAIDYIEAILDRPEIAEVTRTIVFDHSAMTSSSLICQAKTKSRSWWTAMSLLVDLPTAWADLDVPQEGETLDRRGLARELLKGEPASVLALILLLLKNLRHLKLVGRPGEAIYDLCILRQLMKVHTSRQSRTVAMAPAFLRAFRQLENAQFLYPGSFPGRAHGIDRLGSLTWFARSFFMNPSIRRLEIYRIDLGNALKWISPREQLAGLEDVTIVNSHVTQASLRRLLSLWSRTLSRVRVSVAHVRKGMFLSDSIKLMEEHGRNLEYYEVIFEPGQSQATGLKRHGRWLRTVVDTEMDEGTMAAFVTTPSAEEMLRMERGESAFVPATAMYAGVSRKQQEVATTAGVWADPGNLHGANVATRLAKVNGHRCEESQQQVIRPTGFHLKRRHSLS